MSVLAACNICFQNYAINKVQIYLFGNNKLRFKNQKVYGTRGYDHFMKKCISTGGGDIKSKLKSKFITAARYVTQDKVQIQLGLFSQARVWPPSRDVLGRT